MINNNKKSIFFISFILFLYACNQSVEEVKEKKEESKAISKTPTPDFSADSAYEFVKQQVELGPRTPGSIAHSQCAALLVEKLKSYRGEVIVQNGTVKTFDGKQFELKNIIASFSPGLSQRVLLCAHWDTRPFADRDIKDKEMPIDGANDGASGVGVLLEVARNLSTANPAIGVDIIFFDIEDYGQMQDTKFPEQENTWCLGSQYWGQHLHKPGYYANFGILLDMVGAKNAVFPMEGTSMYYAPTIVNKVWETAGRLGYSNYFVYDKTGMTTDDHTYVSSITAIPTIDIVHFDPKTSDYGFFHHRHSDTMENIDRATLKAVGQTVLEVIYSEKPI